MAFRRRRSRRRFGRRRSSGSRWGNAGRQGRVIRSKREWTGFYEFPGCGELISLAGTTSNECWSMEHIQVLPQPPGGGAGDDDESTLLAFRGWWEFWAAFTASSLTPTHALGTTGVGMGLQLAAYRDAAGLGINSIPRDWDDCDNSDWLYRSWVPASSMASTRITGEIAPGVQGNLMLCAREEISITSRKVDWSEWTLFLTFAWPATEDETQNFVRLQARLFESFAGQNSAVG